VRQKIGQIEDQLRVTGVIRFRVCWSAPIAVFVVRRGVICFSPCNAKCQVNTITGRCDIGWSVGRIMVIASMNRIILIIPYGTSSNLLTKQLIVHMHWQQFGFCALH
jgi:hypothetical protein